MKSKRVRMGIQEYLDLEQPFDYKVEYLDGEAVYSPRECVVNAHLNVTPQAVATDYSLLPADISWKQDMMAAFFEAFQDSVEFCDWEVDAIKAFAAKNIKDYFGGIRGQPHPASVIALSPENGTLAGLALLLTDHDGRVSLDLLFVIPPHQRKKVASNLLAYAINRLSADGITELYSAYHICSDISQKWHYANGFTDVYDGYITHLKYGWFSKEIQRRQRLGLVEGLSALEAQRDYWLSQRDAQEW